MKSLQLILLIMGCNISYGIFVPKFSANGKEKCKLFLFSAETFSGRNSIIEQSIPIRSVSETVDTSLIATGKIFFFRKSPFLRADRIQS